MSTTLAENLGHYIEKVILMYLIVIMSLRQLQLKVELNLQRH